MNGSRPVLRAVAHTEAYSQIWLPSLPPCTAETMPYLGQGLLRNSDADIRTLFFRFVRQSACSYATCHWFAYVQRAGSACSCRLMGSFVRACDCRPQYICARVMRRTHLRWLVTCGSLVRKIASRDVEHPVKLLLYHSQDTQRVDRKKKNYLTGLIWRKVVLFQCRRCLWWTFKILIRFKLMYISISCSKNWWKMVW